MSMRPKLKRALGVKVTTNAFYIRSLALAVKEFPLMIGTLHDNNINIPKNVNIGFAVNAPHGLVVPVVKDAHKKSLADIARLEKELTEKARSNKLTLDEIEGETIAFSNLGAYDIESFFGIVPLPASTILAVGNIVNEPIPVDGNFEVRKLVTLSLAVDHRVVEQTYAAKFLSQITARLNSPKTLL